jgi:hypothetical protein
MDMPKKCVINLFGFALVVICFSNCGGNHSPTAPADDFEAKVAKKRAEWKYDCDVMDSMKGPDVKRVFYKADDIIRELEGGRVKFGFAERIYSHASSETKDHIKDLHKYRVIYKSADLTMEIEYDSDTREFLNGIFTFNVGLELKYESYDEMKEIVTRIAEIFDSRAFDFYNKKLDLAYFEKPDFDSTFDCDFDLPDKNIAFTVSKDIKREYHDKTITLEVGWIIHHPNHYYDLL